MAIIIDRTITIKDDKATLDRPLYLYIGDGDITCLFTIEEKKKAATFGKMAEKNSLPMTEGKSYGEVRIYKPDPGSDSVSRLVFTNKADIIDDKLQVIFSRNNIDDFSEAGVHKLQIHLYDEDDEDGENRFTIPPVDLHVLMPVGCDNNTTGEAIAGYSLLDREGEKVPTFYYDEEGNYNYNKTEWQTGDIITSNKLNKIEDALYEMNAADANFVTIDALEAELENKADEGHNHNSLYATKTELNNKANANHSHTNYAATNHSHSGYASSNHTHSGFASSTHNHDGVYLTQSSLSNYATKSYVDNSGFLTSIPAAYVTEGELDNILATKTYASIQYVNNAIQNAGGFSGGSGGTLDPTVYATIQYVDSMTNAKADKTHTHSEYLTTATLDGYASKAYVDDAVANIGIDPEVLAEYAKIENVPTKVTDLDDGIYYATKEDVDEAIAGIGIVNHTHSELTNVVGDTIYFSGTVGLLPSKSDSFDLGHFGNKWKALHVSQIQCYESIYSPYVDVDEVKFHDGTVITGCGEEVEISLSDFAKKTDIPEMVTIPENVSAFANDVGYITKSEVPTNVTDLEDHENYALKTDIPDMPDIPTNVSEFTNDADYATNASVNEAIDTINSNIEDNYATKGEIPTTTEQLINDSGYITSNSVVRIEIVTELPETEEPGVLYIVKA